MTALFITFNVIFGGPIFLADTTSWIIRWMQFLAVLFYSSIMIAKNELGGEFENFNAIRLRSDFELLSIWGAMGCLMGLCLLFYLIGCIGLTVTTGESRRKNHRLKTE